MCSVGIWIEVNSQRAVPIKSLRSWSCLARESGYTQRHVILASGLKSLPKGAEPIIKKFEVPIPGPRHVTGATDMEFLGP